VSQDDIDQLVKDFIVFPIIVLLGIYVTASFICALFFGFSNQFVSGFFTAVGGVGYFVNYFRKKMGEY
jgi:hypothetical protein